MTTQSKFTAAIFDSDGVVVDTVPLHFKAWQRMFGGYGKSFTFEDYKRKVDGIPRVDGARAILTDLSPDEIKKACDIKQGYFLELLDQGGIPVHQTSISLVKELRSHGIGVALISSSKNLPRIIQSSGIGGLWDVVVNGFEITKGKPDPQIFLMAAERLKIPREECVVFEDAVLGVEAAKRGGMVCVGIDRHNDPKALAMADLVVQDLGEVTFDKLEALFQS